MASTRELAAMVDGGLPRALPVGRGLSTLLRGSCSLGGRPAREIRLLIDGREQELAGLWADEGGWWAIADLPGVEQPRDLLVELEAKAAGGWSRSELGTLRIVPGWSPPMLDYAAAAARADGSITGALPLQPKVAVCLATSAPEAEELAARVAWLSALTYPSWLGVLSDEGSTERGLEAIRDALEPARFTVHRSPGGGTAWAGLEHALKAVPADAPYIVLPGLAAALPADAIERMLGALQQGANAVVGRTPAGDALLFRRQLMPYALPLPPQLQADFRPDTWILALARLVGGVEEVELSAPASSNGFHPPAPAEAGDGGVDAEAVRRVQEAINARTLQVRCGQFLSRSDRRRVGRLASGLSSVPAGIDAGRAQAALAAGSVAESGEAPLARASVPVPAEPIELGDGDCWLGHAGEISPLLREASGPAGGEAGVLAKLFSVLPARSGYAVQLGAANGVDFAELLADRFDWDGLHLDRDAPDPVDGEAGEGGGAVVTAREALEPTTIATLLERYGVPSDLDCLVIDTDGLDYRIWDAIGDRWQASVVIVKFNAYAPFGVEATIRREGTWRWTLADGKSYGSTFAALRGLAERHGYRLLHVHGSWRLYFIRSDLGFPAELAVRDPLSEQELALVADPDRFYAGLFSPEARPPDFDAPAPDVSSYPWEIIAPEQLTQTVELDGIELEVPGAAGGGSWPGRRRAFEERASLLYGFLRDEGYAHLIDVGAGPGLAPIFARNAAAGIRGIAVDADPRMARLLRVNLWKNGVQGFGVVNAVAGRTDAPDVGFTLPGAGSGSEDVEVRVPMVRLDGVLERLEVSGRAFLRIDTEGSEHEVLEGLEPWLADRDEWAMQLQFAPSRMRSQGADPAALLAGLLGSYEVVEFPERVRFGTAGLEALFARPLERAQADDFIEHVTAQDSDGRGSLSLLIRPRKRV